MIRPGAHTKRSSQTKGQTCKRSEGYLAIGEDTYRGGFSPWGEGKRKRKQ